MGSIEGILRRIILLSWHSITGHHPSWSRRLLRVLLVGLLLRLLLLPFTGESDLDVFGEASQSMVFGGGAFSYIIVYPPAWEYYLNLVGQAAWRIGGGPLLTTSAPLLVYHTRAVYVQPAYIVVPTYAVIEKLPLVLGDLFVAGLLFLIVKGATGQARLGLAAFGIWFLNPLVIVDSALHGAFDVLPVAFSLASFFLIDQRRTALAGASLGLGTALKVYPAFLLPLALLLVWRGAKGHGRLWGTMAFSLVFFGVLLALFLPPGVLSAYLLYSTTGAGVGQGFWGFGVFSFLSIPVLNAPGAWFAAHTSEVLLAFLAVASLLVVASLLFLARAGETRPFSRLGLYATFVAVYGAWLVNPAVHPQYVEWILPLLILLFVLEHELRLTLALASTLPVAFYLFTLGNPLIFFEPLGLYANFAPLWTFLAPSRVWGPLAPTISMITSVPLSIALLYALYQRMRRLRREGGVQS